MKINKFLHTIVLFLQLCSKCCQMHCDLNFSIPYNGKIYYLFSSIGGRVNQNHIGINKRRIKIWKITSFCLLHSCQNRWKKPCYVSPDHVPLKAELSVIDGVPMKDTTIIMLLRMWTSLCTSMSFRHKSCKLTQAGFFCPKKPNQTKALLNPTQNHKQTHKQKRIACQIHLNINIKYSRYLLGIVLVLKTNRGN